MRQDEYTGREFQGWCILVAMLIVGCFAVYDSCTLQGQDARDVYHMKAITKYNNVSDQLVDELDSLEGMWKRYATEQRTFARHHNREVTIADVRESDLPRLEKLGASAIRANEELVLHMFDLIEQLKEQATLTAVLAQNVDRLVDQVRPEETIN